LKKTFGTDYEVILVANNNAPIIGKRIGSVWSVNKDGNADYKHPTQKPIALIEMALDSVSKQEDVVLDLFGGSGSTLIACEKTNRKCRMIELDERYCDVIRRRYTKWAKENGKPITSGCLD
jgi:DNA modification methylase